MQTSQKLPVTVYCSEPVEADMLRQFLPEASEIVSEISQLHPQRLAILLCNDSSQARSSVEWINSQPAWRQQQLLLILPREVTRLNAACKTLTRPFRLAALRAFISHTTPLPPLEKAENLTDTEQDIVSILYANGSPMQQDALQKTLWNDHADTETHKLETHLYRLRKKLENTAFEIITENGGYHLQKRIS